MWEDPAFSQSFFNTDLQTLQTTTPAKVLDCASVAPVVSELEHRATTLILFQNTACQVQVRNQIFQDVVEVYWLISVHYPSAFRYIAANTSSVQTKLKNISFKNRSVRV